MFIISDSKFQICITLFSFAFQAAFQILCIIQHSCLISFRLGKYPHGLTIHVKLQSPDVHGGSEGPVSTETKFNSRLPVLDLKA